MSTRTFCLIVVLLCFAPQHLFAGRIVWPCSGRVTSPYGPRTSPCSGCSDYHHGIDIGVGSGTVLGAPASGTVSYYGFDSCGGNIYNISYGGGWVTRFLHCSGSIVAPGNSVSQNQDVARSGNTGSCTTGPHLHFEVLKDGVSQMVPGTSSPRTDVVRGTEVPYDYPGLNDRPKASPSMMYDVMNVSMSIYRWTSNGASLSLLPVTTFGNGYRLSDVGSNVVASDVDGDGIDDNVVAYQYANGAMKLHVFKGGNSYQGGNGWFQSGSFDMQRVGGRMVGGDFNGDGKGDVAMLYDNGSGGMTVFRFISNGISGFQFQQSSFNNYDLSRVKDHVAVADVNGDGKDDIVIACQTGSTWKMEALLGATTLSPNQWFTGGSFNLDNVNGRMVGGDFNGDGRGDVALFYKNGGGMTLYRFVSNGGSFNYSTLVIASGYNLDDVGKHIGAGDIDGDGKDDVVLAYQYPDGKFRFHLFKDALVYGGPAGIYQSGAFSLDNVSGRMTVGTGFVTNSPTTNSDVNTWSGY